MCIYICIYIYVYIEIYIYIYNITYNTVIVLLPEVQADRAAEEDRVGPDVVLLGTVLLSSLVIIKIMIVINSS